MKSKQCSVFPIFPLSLPMVTDFPMVPSCHPNSQHTSLLLHTYLADMKTCPVILKHLNCFNISLQTALPLYCFMALHIWVAMERMNYPNKSLFMGSKFKHDQVSEDAKALLAKISFSMLLPVMSCPITISTAL